MAIYDAAVRAVYGCMASPVAARVMERLVAVWERQTLRKLLSEIDIDCVVDVGGNEGQYARLLRRLGFTGLILSFEPHPEVFQTMKRRFAGDAGWRGYDCALGRRDGELDFHIYALSQNSSCLPGSDLLARPERTVKVPVKRLDALLPSILPDWRTRRLFVKCDTQGFDVEVIAGAQEILPAVYGLQSEVAVTPLYQGMPRYLEALRFYESLGFVLIDLWLNNRTSGGEVLEYDCLMKRTTPVLGPSHAGVA